MNVSAPFIRRPVATTLLTAGLALSGILGFRLLPVASLPQVDFPTIQVSAALPGASPETMATSVAAPLERQFGRIAGITEMTSTSNLGSTAIVMQFDLDRDIDGAARDVQAAISAARGDLPTNLPSNPSYRKVNPADAPILILALTSDTMSIGRLYDVASTRLQQQLAQVDGVGQVVVGGSSLPAVRVELNPTALARHGVGLEDVRTLLAGTNLRRPKGAVADGQRRWAIDANDQLHGAVEYRPLVVARTADAVLRLDDVGTVEDSVEDLRANGVANGRPSVLIVMFRSPGANVVETVDRVRARLPELREGLPAAIDLRVVLDRTPPILASLHDVELTLVVSVVLVVLVVFAFLGDARAALIPSVAVPVSLVGTFGVMYLCGFSLDNLSLMALTIATGFVVDDAIVVLENVSRHVESGMPVRAAALRGAGEIGFTVLSMSLSLIAVFLPILLMGGMIGRLFREFAVTLSVAIALSLVVSLTTTPMMCSALLRPHHGGGGPGRVARGVGRAFARLTRGYDRSLSWALTHAKTMLLATLLTVVLNVFLFVHVPKGFFPQQDAGRLGGTIIAAQDISFQAMREKLAAVVDVIGRDPAVDDVIGFTGGGGGNARNTARMFVALKPLDERSLSADAVIGRLRPTLAAIPGAPTYLQAVQDLRIGGRPNAAQYQYTLQSQQVRDLVAWGPKVLAALRALPQLADVNTDQQDRGLETTLAVDRDTAARLGLSLAAVDDTLNDAFGQRQVSVTYTPQNQYHVVMEVAPPYWQRPETLRDLYVRADDGGMVPLAAFTHWSTNPTTLAVNHQGQFPAVTISFNLVPGVALGDAVSAIQDATRRLGLPETIRGSFTGAAQAFQTSLASEPLLVAAALAAVYVVLGILYESSVHPITILSTLPSAGVGAIVALLVCGTELSVIALIGILLLIGIVKKNAIMMIDVALEAERTRGIAPEQAIHDACLLRLRPILMTTMAALLGALPLALGTGTGAEMRRPLGISIVGGLLVSQALTLYTTPVVYLALDRFRVWVIRRRRALVAAAMLGASACAVGPDYVRPTAPVPAVYEELDGWKTAQPQDAVPRGPWWSVFGDPGLDALASQVRVANETVHGAEAQLAQARALVASARASWYPTVEIGLSANRARTSDNLGSTSFGRGHTVSDYAMPITFAWEADLWGRIRRQVESSEASAAASAADLEGVRLSLETELAADWFQLRAIDADRRLLDDAVAAFTRSLALTRSRYASGVASRADVVQAETQLESTRAQAVDLGVQRAQLEHAIAVLVGQPPANVSVPPAPLAATPPGIPVDVPSTLLERRPDIAAAERRVAAANADIGVAEAAYYPTVDLSASGGFESGSIDKWLVWPSRFFSLGPSVTETVYDGGRRAAQTAQARAAYDASVAAYRQTVLTGFGEVEDALAALRVLADEAGVQAAAVAAARESVTLTTQQYEGGIVSYLNVVTVQTAALTDERTAVDIAGRRMVAAVQLIGALGGGWHAADLAASS